MIHLEILVRRKSHSFVTGPNMVIYTVDRLPIGLPPCPVPTAKMVRGRKQGIATKIGAPDHFSGFKLAFLVSKAASYQQCMDSKTVPEFYNKVTKDFISKYGGDEPFNKEPAEDPPDPEGRDGIVGDHDRAQEALSKEEAAKNAVIFTKLRTVSRICMKYQIVF
jgi:hypothetical protein